jgi:hypothetical protein
MKSDQPVVDDISHLPDQQQAELIAEQFASIQNGYEALKKTTYQYHILMKDKYPSFINPRFGLY